MLIKLNLIIFSALLAKTVFVDCRPRDGYFTVVAPATVRSNSTLNVAVSLSEFHQSSWVNISLLGTNSENFGVHHSVEVQPGTTKLVILKVPPLNAIEGVLKVRGYRGIVWSDSVRVLIKELNYQVYIQTDKQLYKPGEVVRFRVICFDELTRPAVVNDSLDVLIYNSEGIIVKKIPNINVFKGVFKGELHLSEYTHLGEWEIVVNSNNSPIKRTCFNVSRYTLTNFKVHLSGYTDISLTDGKLNFTVKAMYIHEEPICGTLSMNLNILNHESYTAESDSKVISNLPINGAREIILDFEKDLNLNRMECYSQSGVLYTVTADVLVNDSFSGEVITSTMQIKIHSHPYKVELEAPKTFDPSTLVELKVMVTNLQNEGLGDLENPVKIQVMQEDMSVTDDTFVTLDKHGIGAVHLNLSDKDVQEYSVTAEYRGFTSMGKNLKKIPETTFKLNVLTESPQVGDEFIVALESKTPIDHFIYEIISRGNILHTERVTVPENATTHQLHLTATFSMVPVITIYVHRIKDKIFDSTLKDVYIKRTFKNSIEIRTESEVKPGALVSVNVTTDEESYVGLMAIDERLLNRTEETADLTEDHVFTRLRDYNSYYAGAEQRPGSSAGLVTLINSEIPGFTEIDINSRFGNSDNPGEGPAKTGEGPEVNWPRVRQFFADSWLFEDLERIQADGWQLHTTCPDSITSWAITGFSLNPETGLSLTRNTTRLNVFKPFYITMDLPTSVKEGETIEISVYVFNYLNQSAITDVSFESESEHLLIVDDEDVTFKVEQTLFVSQNGRVKINFFVKAKTSGHFNLTMQAKSLLASDAIQKTLIVEPEGIPHLLSKTYLVNFAEDSTEEDTILLNISTNAVPGSERIELSVIGDILGPLMESLKSLAHVPIGTGLEINTHFVANTLVLKYLKTLGHSTPRLEAMCLKFMEKGYQSLLRLKQLNGSFSLVNSSTGDTLHTASVLWGLQQARGFIEIDHKIIKRGLKYLISRQTSAGSFSVTNRLEDDIALTSLAVLAFLANSATADKYKDVIANGMRFLYEIRSQVKSRGLLAISAYALISGKHEESGELLAKLQNHSHVLGKDVLWTRSDSLQSNLKITAENFLNLLSRPKPIQSMFPIVRALLVSRQLENQKLPHHLLALDAMIAIARNMDFSSKSLSLEIKSDRGEATNLRIDSSNVHVMQSFGLNHSTRSLRLRTSGKGFAVINVKYRYNLLQEHAPPAPGYRTNLTILDRRGMVENLQICVSVQSPQEESSFTAMEINLPSGYEILQTALNKNFNEHVMSIRVKDKSNSIFVVVKDVTPAGECIQLETLKVFAVTKVKPMSTVVYDIFKEDRKVTFLHEIAQTA